MMCSLWGRLPGVCGGASRPHLQLLCPSLGLPTPATKHLPSTPATHTHHGIKRTFCTNFYSSSPLSEFGAAREGRGVWAKGGCVWGVKGVRGISLTAPRHMFWEKDPKGGYGKEIKKSHKELIRDGLKELRQEMSKWQEEMNDKFDMDPIFVLPGECRPELHLILCWREKRCDELSCHVGGRKDVLLCWREKRCDELSCHVGGRKDVLLCWREKRCDELSCHVGGRKDVLLCWREKRCDELSCHGGGRKDMLLCWREKRCDELSCHVGGRKDVLLCWREKRCDELSCHVGGRKDLLLCWREKKCDELSCHVGGRKDMTD
ncbi:uncharacterized protein LOC127004986 isoform X2 [Eriocheir sinensis]|uniref:uncharacterized protein LOC127004986 isoform X2 n=1 Tax=Eriocheir sinensis TaxID=95602 RepID=UPI0021CA4642|nr:uncharacterized protein LOC127004986 isoform X2 [Eriocheir sinensis]